MLLLLLLLFSSSLSQSVGSQDGVSSCAVEAVNDLSTLPHLSPSVNTFSHQPRLVAFAVPHPPTLSTGWTDQLMAALVGVLPGHMVPDLIVPVHHLPCNRNGMNITHSYVHSHTRIHTHTLW